MTIIGGTEFEPTTLEELDRPTSRPTRHGNYANAGVGAASHLCGLLFETRRRASTSPRSQYEGTGPAMDDLLGNQVDFMCDQTTNTTTQIKAASIKALRDHEPERIDALPDVPTTAEAGLAGRPGHASGTGSTFRPTRRDEVVDALTAALQGRSGRRRTSSREFAEARHDAGGRRPGDAGGAHGQSSTEQIEVWRATPRGRRRLTRSRRQRRWRRRTRRPALASRERRGRAAEVPMQRSAEGRPRRPASSSRFGLASRRGAGLRHRRPRAHGPGLLPAGARRAPGRSSGSSIVVKGLSAGEEIRSRAPAVARRWS